MKLSKIMQRDGINYEKVLIPKNSGLETMNPDPLKALGIEKGAYDKYKDNSIGIEIERYRGEDIPYLCDEYTKQGIAVVGLTGDDLFDEYKLKNKNTKLKLLDTIDWIIKPEKESQAFPQYQRPTLCLVSEEGLKIEDIPSKPRIVINSKYAYQGRAYLEDLKEDYGVLFKKISYSSGCIENQVGPIADYAIDIVVTGKSLKYLDAKEKEPKIERTPRLVVIDEIRQSDMSVISSWQKEENKFGRITKENDNLESVLRLQYEMILQRKASPTQSRTSALLQDENKLIKQFGEESAETIRAYIRKDAANIIEETQQILWLCQTMMAGQGISWDEFLYYVKDQQR